MAEETLTREAETIERKALAALHQAADAGLRERLALSLAEVGDALVSVAGALPASAITVNRSMGLGRSTRPSADDVAAIQALYAGAGVPRHFVQPDPAAAIEEVAPVLEAAGLRRSRSWQKFARGRDEPVPEIETEVEIREVGPGDGVAAAEIICAAFDLGGAARPWIARLSAAGGWRVFIGFVDGAPAGAGALFLDGDVAYTDFGATRPEFRGRGAQSASLAHRVRTALVAGARRIHTCTGVAVPGDPQHSYANIRRCGFTETHVRHTWAPPGT